MKKLSLLIAIVCAFSVSATAQIPNTAGWYEVPNTMIRPVCWNGGNCANVILAWGGGIFDTQRNRAIVWGGGHGDYSGNEQYAINFSGTPSAQMITNNTNPGACSQPSCDGGVTPNARHTYDQLTYMANYDAMFVWSGALSGTGYGQQDAWMYFYGTQQWQYLNPISTGPMPVGSTNNAFVEYDPVTGTVFVWDGRSLYQYNYATKTWVSRFFTENGYLAGYFVGALDPVRRKLFAKHSAGGMAWFDISDPAPADPRHALTPTGDTAILSVPNPGMAYDPVSTHILMWGGGNTVYDYNPDTNVITAITDYTGGPGAQQLQGTFGRWQYSAPIDGFIVVNSVDQNAFVFRNRGGAPPPPPPPPTLPDVLTVGPGKLFQTISAAVAACTACTGIDIDAGVYLNESATITRNITMRGVGGYAHLKWGTGDSLTNTTNIPNGKALLIINANVTLENMEFSGAKVVDGNGAGIRYEGGNLSIRRSYSHGNENGIMGQAGATNTLLIEHSIFDQNGFCGSGGCAHNVYIGSMGRLIFRHNKSVDSRDGSHTLKSRALVNEVYGNFLSTKNSDGSYEADFPNGGTVYFVGNVVEQGANTSNSTILGYGLEGSTNPNPKLFAINNTFNNLRSSGATFVQVSGTPALSIKNNIFAGGGTAVLGGSTDLSSNKDLLLANFINASAGDYHLVSTSTAVDAGVAPGVDGTYSLTPAWEYVEPAEKAARMVAGALDTGAYEYGTSAPPPPPPPPPPSSCISDPLTLTNVQWPASASSANVLGYDSGNKNLAQVLFTWPDTLTATDDRGCMVTVFKAPNPPPPPPPPPPTGLVIVDIASDRGGFGNASTVTWVHPATTPNYVRVSWAAATAGNFGFGPASVTYGGQSMTLVGSASIANVDGSGSEGRAEIWELVNPPTGSQSVVITFPKNLYGNAGAVSYSGVNTTNPSGNAVVNVGTGTTDALAVSAASGETVSDAVFLYQSSSAPVPNQTSRFRAAGFIGTHYWGAGQTAPGGASVNMQWAGSTSTKFAHVAATIHAQ